MEQKDFLLFAGVLIGIILVASLLTYVTANAISLNPRYTFASCTDSDGGKDVYVKGNVTQGRKKIVDSCNTFRRYSVKEGYCAKTDIGGRSYSYATSQYIKCPRNSTVQYVCSKGACVLP